MISLFLYFSAKVQFFGIFENSQLNEMKNYYIKKTDGINLYLELNIKTQLFGKVLLLICILMAFVPILFLAYDSHKNPESTSDFVFPALIIVGLIIIFPVRYLIWNCYGKEFIVINKKSISYNYNYKIISTNLKTIKIDHLGTFIEIVKEDNGTQYGKLLFYNYDNETNLPEFVFQTTVLLDINMLQEIENTLWQLLTPKEEKDSLQTFYVN